MEKLFLYRFTVEYVDKQNGQGYEIECSTISSNYSDAYDKIHSAIKEYVEFEEDEYQDITSVTRNDIGQYIE